jgi:DNA-binding NarL/FixJ family response regulator
VSGCRALIADDHPAFRAGLRFLLEASGIEVVGEAATGREAVARARELAPDVVLMDLSMPDLNGIEATAQLVAAAPGTGVIVLTMFEQDESLFAAVRAGARGYLLKGAEGDEIVRAVLAVQAGEALFGAALASRLAAHFASAAPAAAIAFPQLTLRERQVLDLIAAGRPNGAIAEELVLSLKTVRNHVSTIFAKLRVADRAGAIIAAREAGLGRSVR